MYGKADGDEKDQRKLHSSHLQLVYPGICNIQTKLTQTFFTYFRICTTSSSYEKFQSIFKALH